MAEKYFLSTDDSGHWYIVPVARREEWYEWNSEETWDAPEWAQQVGGSPTLVQFENPEVVY